MALLIIIALIANIKCARASDPPGEEDEDLITSDGQAVLHGALLADQPETLTSNLNFY